jgi:Zn finger protein HypA/HybF involved in hydrogenase expression
MADEYPSQRIVSVALEVGMMSGVEAELLASALKEEQQNHDSTIEYRIDMVPLQAECRVCLESFDLDGFSFICSKCGTSEIEVTRGDSVQILSVTLEETPV